MSYTGTKAQMALGTTISIGATPTVIGEVKSLSQSGAKWDVEDATNLQSTAKEFVNALPDSGEFSVDGSRVSSDAGQIALEAAFASGDITPFTIQLPKAKGQATGDKFTFNALVIERNFSFNTGKLVTFSAKLKISGSITTTIGA